MRPACPVDCVAVVVVQIIVEERVVPVEVEDEVEDHDFEKR